MLVVYILVGEAHKQACTEGHNLDRKEARVHANTNTGHFTERTNTSTSTGEALLQHPETIRWTRRAQIATDKNGSDGDSAARAAHDAAANDDVNIYIHLKLQLRLVATAQIDQTVTGEIDTERVRSPSVA